MVSCRAEAAALKDEVPRSQVSEGLMMMAEQGLLVPIEDAVKEVSCHSSIELSKR